MGTGNKTITRKQQSGFVASRADVIPRTGMSAVVTLHKGTWSTLGVSQPLLCTTQHLMLQRERLCQPPMPSDALKMTTYASVWPSN